MPHPALAVEHRVLPGAELGQLVLDEAPQRPARLGVGGRPAPRAVVPEGLEPELVEVAAHRRVDLVLARGVGPRRAAQTAGAV